MNLDPTLQDSLLSAIFILLGSLAFNISALISGYNVYREMAGIQSVALSLGAGIVIFFISPVGFIALLSPPGSISFISIFDFDVLIPFLSGSLGLGLVFGSLITLEARDNFLLWFRDRSGIMFWINSYSIIWDFFFRRVRRGGEISVKTKSGETLDCYLEYYSMRNAPKEIAVKSCFGDEGHLLIRGDEIEKVKIPEHSFRKYHGLITPIGQAFYFGLICSGLLLLCFSVSKTGTYIKNSPTAISYPDNALSGLTEFYENLGLCLFFLTIIAFFLSMFLAKRDYSNKWAYFMTSSDCLFLFVISIFICIYVFFFIPAPLESYSILIFFQFILIILAVRIIWYLIFLKYIEDDILNELVRESVGYESLNRVLNTFYLNLCRNFPHDNRSHLENVRDEVYNKLSDEDLEVAEMIILKLNMMKCKYNFLRNEDFKLLCILLSKLNHPGGLYRLFMRNRPILGRIKPNLEDSINRALAEYDPVKKAIFLLNISYYLHLSSFKNKDLKKYNQHALNNLNSEIRNQLTSLINLPNNDSTKDEIYLKDILKAIKKIVDKSRRQEVLSWIITTDDLRMLAIQTVDDGTKVNPYLRANIMVKAASNLSWNLRTKELKKALCKLIKENSENDVQRYLKSKTLVEIAPKLPDNLRQHAIADALKSANAIQDNYYRSKALVEIAPLLPDPLKEELLKKARETIRGTDSNLFEMDIEYSS